MGPAPPLDPGLDQELVPGPAPEEAALTPQDRVSQQPSLRLRTVRRAMAADTERNDCLREGYATKPQSSPDA